MRARCGKVEANVHISRPAECMEFPPAGPPSAWSSRQPTRRAHGVRAQPTRRVHGVPHQPARQAHGVPASRPAKCMKFPPADPPSAWSSGPADPPSAWSSPSADPPSAWSSHQPTRRVHGAPAQPARRVHGVPVSRGRFPRHTRAEPGVPAPSPARRRRPCGTQAARTAQRSLAGVPDPPGGRGPPAGRVPAVSVAERSLCEDPLSTRDGSRRQPAPIPRSSGTRRSRPAAPSGVGGLATCAVRSTVRAG